MTRTGDRYAWLWYPIGVLVMTFIVGNAFVTVKRFETNVWAFLNSLHTASGMDAVWVLLADSIAGSFIVLALTGVLLWTRLHGPRLLAAALGLGALLLGVWFAWRAM